MNTTVLAWVHRCTRRHFKLGHDFQYTCCKSWNILDHFDVEELFNSILIFFQGENCRLYEISRNISKILRMSNAEINSWIATAVLQPLSTISFFFCQFSETRSLVIKAANLTTENLHNPTPHHQKSILIKSSPNTSSQNGSSLRFPDKDVRYTCKSVLCSCHFN